MKIWVAPIGSSRSRRTVCGRPVFAAFFCREGAFGGSVARAGSCSDSRFDEIVNKRFTALVSLPSAFVGPIVEHTSPRHLWGTRGPCGYGSFRICMRRVHSLQGDSKSRATQGTPPQSPGEINSVIPCGPRPTTDRRREVEADRTHCLFSTCSTTRTPGSGPRCDERSTDELLVASSDDASR